MGKFPGGQAGALQQGAGLIDPDRDAVAPMRRLNHALRGAVRRGGGQRPRVAVMQDAVAGLEQIGTHFGQAAVARLVVGGDRVGAVEQSRADCLGALLRMVGDGPSHQLGGPR